MRSPVNVLVGTADAEKSCSMIPVGRVITYEMVMTFV